MNSLIRQLKLNKDEFPRNDFLKDRKDGSIKESKEFKNGYHKYYEFNSYVIKIMKPGKEANQRNKAGEIKNPFDAPPAIFKEKKLINIDPSFNFIFKKFVDLSHKNKECLDLIGHLLVLNAYMLNHDKDKKGRWRYNPNTDVLDYLDNKLGNFFEIPTLVFLYYLELIALNEDVKYSRTHNVYLGYGRRNNVLTYVHLISVLLQRSDFTKFISSLSRIPVGVAPIAQKDILNIFYK